MNFLIKFFLALVIIASTAAAQTQSPNPGKKITQDAVWDPSANIMQKIISDCGTFQDEDIGKCFLNEMVNSGASRQAIEFSKMIDGKGYMKAYKQLGIIDAAYVYYPFEKIKRNGCLLLNGKPEIIDVDDPQYLPLSELSYFPEYVELKKNFPQIAVFPGERQSTGSPAIENLPMHGERITVNYNLKDGCDRCALLGFLDMAFDFDSTGKFISSKILRVIKSDYIESQSTVAGAPANVFDDPSKPIDVGAGDSFAIALQSNHSAGLKWELAEPFDNQIIKLVGTNFSEPFETLPNAAGKEVWNFKAAGKGSAEIKLNYVYSWQSGSNPLQTVTFRVNIN